MEGEAISASLFSQGLPLPFPIPLSLLLAGAQSPALASVPTYPHWSVIPKSVMPLAAARAWLLLSLALSLLPPRLPPSPPGSARATGPFLPSRKTFSRPVSFAPQRNDRRAPPAPPSEEGLLWASHRSDRTLVELLFNWNELAASLMVDATALIIKDGAPLVNFRFRFKAWRHYCIADDLVTPYLPRPE